MRVKMLLRPGWIGLTLGVVVFAVACYLLLAPWQFGRNDERSASNKALRDSLGATPVALDSVLPGGAVPSEDTQWRRVTLTGSYLPDAEALARLRTVDGSPAFEVLTPFRLVDGTVVLLDRGYVRPAQGVRVPDYAASPTGQVQVIARIQPDETDPQHRPAFTEDGHRQVYAIESATVGRAANLTIRPGYLLVEAGSPGVLSALPLPQLDSGPYLSYALQWIAFGSMAIVALGYFTWRELQPGGALTRRRRSVGELVAAEEAAEEEQARPARQAQH